MTPIRTAFVQAAGLGTRLRPLTDACPKPLVEVAGRPIITYVFDQLLRAGIERIILNTHHRAEKYATTFPDQTWKNIPLVFRHEPELLETGGGIRNILDLIQDEEHLLVCNGDVITDLPIAKLTAHHLSSGNEVTLALRSQGTPLNVSCDAQGNLTDIRHELGAAYQKDYLFASVYALKTSFIHRIPPAQKCSVIPFFLSMIKNHEKIGALVLDEGSWYSIETPADHQRVNQTLANP